MENKVVLVLVDGMRPDGILECGEPYLQDLAAQSSASFAAKTVFPSITLPCHTSLFFGVQPQRHGVLTNEWRPFARPFDSLGDLAARQFKKAAMFYNWEQLRDLNRPGSLSCSYFRQLPSAHEDAMRSEQDLTALAMDDIQQEAPDFLFLYLGYTDIAGHGYGWMTPHYLQALANASRCIRRLKEALPEEYALIVTADHGGHEQDHGYDCPEDMTIPIIFNGKAFAANTVLQDLHLIDITPTIGDLLGLHPLPEWEGKSVLSANR